ncbi:ATP-binding protein [Providencia rettgeri]|uniref:ATP-binding protein n=1 Tax=Providencia rettgeri TaxID=587 RepID=A0A264VYA9_PRORE|nr:MULTISPECIES: ATP-binding protein [Providencia]MBQ0533467.1 ATP-binding protein [Providencia huaxiensis]MBQ0587024.1 ATP-binding protein [Providencia huaxiensis]MDI7238293.1 ATP-binding protein [Providencia huaxiensis]OZS76275.1 ATP-binding protein [Providencia rettgeri]
MNAAQIRELVVNALKGKTAAENRVYSPMDWSTVGGEYPCIIVQTPFDHKKSLGRNVPQFNTVTTVRVTGRLEEFDGEELDGAMKAELALEALREQIERAVINSYELTRQIQQFLEVRSQIDISAMGEGHLAQLLMDLDIEYYQGPEEFYPIEADPLTSINIDVQQPDGTPEHHVTINLT